MRQSTSRPDVIAAFVLGLAAGGGVVGIFAYRQVQAEHRYANLMSSAIQRANSAGRAEQIRAHELAANAFEQARKSTIRARRAEDRLGRRTETQQLHSGGK